MTAHHPTIEVHIPWPPSVNQIWRRRRGRTYRNPKYVAWIKEAGWATKAARVGEIKGEFQAEIILYPPKNFRGDADNRIKAVLDLAQEMKLIENDRLCRQLVVSYGDSKTQSVGVLLRLFPWDNMTS